jgi:hypothetical protein
VLDHVRVADWPAVIVVGLTDSVTVGVSAGGAEDPLPPQACSARPVRAVAAAAQDFRIRKLVRIVDMLPRLSGVLRAQAAEHDPTRERSRKYGIVRGTLLPSVNSHTARLARREIYSVTRSNYRDGLRRCASREPFSAAPAGALYRASRQALAGSILVMRIALTLLSGFFSGRKALVVYRPETSIRRHRAEWKLFCADAGHECPVTGELRDSPTTAAPGRFGSSERTDAPESQIQRAAAAPVSSGRLLKAMAVSGAAR